MAEVKDMNLSERMSAISCEVGSVAKNINISTGKNTYKALSNVDVINAVKPVMAKYRVYGYPVEKKVINSEVLDIPQPDGTVKKQFYCNIETTMRFVNMDNSSEFLDVKGYGCGLDSGDKFWGKADSYSLKYCLISAFMLAGEDPDNEASKEIIIPAKKNWKEEPASRDQKDIIIKAQVALTDAQFNNLTKGQADTIIKELNQKGSAANEFKNYKKN